MTFVHALISCKDQSEAHLIGEKLLQERLIACYKVGSEVESTYWWKGAITKSKEVVLEIDSHESRCHKIEGIVSQIHSYETFVLVALPMVYISKEARLWLQDSMNLLGV